MHRQAAEGGNHCLGVEEGRTHSEEEEGVLKSLAEEVEEMVAFH